MPSEGVSSHCTQGGGDAGGVDGGSGGGLGDGGGGDGEGGSGEGLGGDDGGSEGGSGGGATDGGPHATRQSAPPALEHRDWVPNSFVTSHTPCTSKHSSSGSSGQSRPANNSYSLHVEHGLGGHAGGGAGGGDGGEAAVQSARLALTQGNSPGGAVLENVHVPSTTTHCSPAGRLMGNVKPGATGKLNLMQVEQGSNSWRMSSAAPPGAKLPICPLASIVYVVYSFTTPSFCTRTLGKYSFPSAARQYLNSIDSPTVPMIGMEKPWSI